MQQLTTHKNKINTAKGIKGRVPANVASPTPLPIAQAVAIYYLPI
jgi:hypothetical protein